MANYKYSNPITLDSVNIEVENKINTFKMLLYKEYLDILEKIDFNNEEAFCNPLLYAFFRHKTLNTFPQEIEKQLISNLLQGYFVKNDNLDLTHLYNIENIAYVPNIGYFKKDHKDCFNPIVKVEGSPSSAKCPHFAVNKRRNYQ
jgi:hypothetical protein